MNVISGSKKMNTSKNVSKLIVTAFVSLMAVSIAVASPLSQPKTDGLIGEQANGYIGLVDRNVPADVKKLVNDVNAKRKAGYQKIADEQGTSLAEVERVGGNKAMAKTLSGNYIREADGAWRKK